ncbi:MAG: hypothetical protein A2Y14_01735 [Verrucomicrobia bacterium GWF2_51_19]|nr:MAG: hypothetical protein A2Y14_01735 [Verrucomicrobia bacterium GWF2_51_19]
MNEKPLVIDKCALEAPGRFHDEVVYSIIEANLDDANGPIQVIFDADALEILHRFYHEFEEDLRRLFRVKGAIEADQPLIISQSKKTATTLLQ